jgi:osmoprotectant transport system permease protein
MGFRPPRVASRIDILISCQRGTEQKILGALLKRLFQAALSLGDDKIAVEYESGGGALTFISLYRGKTDVCPAYTWQGYEMTLGASLRFSAEELRRLNVDESIRRLAELYERSELQWLPHLGFSSNWELVMLDEKAAALSIDAVEDLPSKSGRLTLGCPREFFARDAAYGSLEREGNEFSKVVFLEGEELYDALLERRVDVVVGFSTDPRLDSSAFRALKPTRQLFGDHYAVPVAREEIVSKYPGIRQAVQRLGKAIDGAGGEGRQHIRELVRRAEGAGSTPAAVELIAEDFLKRKNLL